MELSWHGLRELMEANGSPLYLLDLNRFESNCKLMLGAFREFYPKTELSYSYKTNYIPDLCQLAHQSGGYAEVVSRMELDLALRLGVPGDRIIFNGPVKSQDDLQAAIRNSVLIHVDSLPEVEQLQRVAASAGPPTPIRVGLRCNFRLSPDHRSRFGLDVPSGELVQALDQLRQIPSIHILGLHCHFSHFRDLDSFARRAESMAQLAKQHFATSGLDFLDIGGGFCGTMPPEMKAQFDYDPPTFQDYGKVIGDILRDHFGEIEGPRLLLEPGMAVVADCMRFAVEVKELKTVGDKNFVVTNGSTYNIRPTFSRVNLPIEIFTPTPGQSSTSTPPADVVGYTCMEVDVLHRNLTRRVEPGDIVVFSNVGAYTVVLLPPFIRPAPAIVSIHNGHVRTSRRAEQLDDILVTYNLSQVADEPST